LKPNTRGEQIIIHLSGKPIRHGYFAGYFVIYCPFNCSYLGDEMGNNGENNRLLIIHLFIRKI